ALGDGSAHPHRHALPHPDGAARPAAQGRRVAPPLVHRELRLPRRRRADRARSVGDRPRALPPLLTGAQRSRMSTGPATGRGEVAAYAAIRPGSARLTATGSDPPVTR